LADFGEKDTASVGNTQRRRFSLGTALAPIAVLVIFMICLVLWRFEVLRPYLATLGAGLAAFLSPLPGLLAPETRGKWTSSVIIAAFIAAGTWFATKDLDDRWRDADAKRSLLAERLNSLNDSFESLVDKI
jgi:hypothetical protein